MVCILWILDLGGGEEGGRDRWEASTRRKDVHSLGTKRESGKAGKRESGKAAGFGIEMKTVENRR